VFEFNGEPVQWQLTDEEGNSEEPLLSTQQVRDSTAVQAAHCRCFYRVRDTEAFDDCEKTRRFRIDEAQKSAGTADTRY
jgi:hypothetical protein